MRRKSWKGDGDGKVINLNFYLGPELLYQR